MMALCNTGVECQLPHFDPVRSITLSTQDAEERAAQAQAEEEADSFVSKDRSAVVRAVVSVAGSDADRSPAVRRGTVTDISNE
jgi:hypothetical protein